ncbi:MAG: energy transducer TonB [Candidatus Aminicenantes bacterium]|nr:energy transducer TonB [Candidatus Aminicenantes bacterium]
MFQDALFIPDRHLRAKAAALPTAALIHVIALALLVTVPLLRVGDLPEVGFTGVIIVPMPPATPLPPPKARAGNPGSRIVKKPAAAAVGSWRVAPVDIPDGIIEEGLGADGAEGGIEGGVDYGAGGGLPANLEGGMLYRLVGDPVEPVIRAVGEIKAPRLVRKVEPDYPEIARQARVEGVVILEATTDVYGRVTGVRVLRSLPLLDAAAVDAVRQWVYEPMVINGRPRPVTFTVTVRFVLK